MMRSLYDWMMRQAASDRAPTALFWVSFIVSVTVAAAFIPDDGHAPVFALFGSLIYLVGLLVHSLVGRRGRAREVLG